MKFLQSKPRQLTNEFDIFFKFKKERNAQYVVTIQDGEADIKQLMYGSPCGEYGKPVDIK